MNDVLPVSVIVPVSNEAANLGKCLSRLHRFQEVIVVDSGSTDGTVEIAAAQGAKVVNFEWNGRYPKKRNWVLLNHRLASDWVLFLDADEFVTDAFCEALRHALRNTVHRGFWLRYNNHFFGKRLRFGVPQRKLAVFRVGAGLYERIDEDNWSGLDMEIHEHPVIEGTVGEVTAPIDHQDYKGLGKFIEKHRDYAMWEAQRYCKLQDDDVAAAKFTSRQRFKYRHLAKWWYPGFYFIFAYFAKLGFLDGGAGFNYAAYKAWYFQTIRLLIKEIQSTN